MSRLSLTYFIYVPLLIAYFLTCSCGTNKKITYFKDVPDSLYKSAQNIAISAYTDPVIHSNDILQISILTLDPGTNNVLTAANSSSYSVQAGTPNAPASGGSVTGFLVDKNGEVELPIIGKIKVGGLTTSAARDSIHSRVALYFKDPVVNVRFANFSITILGEVAKPATYIVPSEKISVLDAIGLAGDLTIYGKRENILLIRDSANVKQMVRFNLNSSETLLSPYFYLRQGDVIYVEPAKSKIASTDAMKARNISLLASGLSLLVVIFTRL